MSTGIFCTEVSRRIGHLPPGVSPPVLLFPLERTRGRSRNRYRQKNPVGRGLAPAALFYRVSPCGARYFPSDGKVPKGSPGDAADGHCVPIGPLTPGPPFTRVTPWVRQNPSGAQNLSECLNPHRATGPWVCEKLGQARFHNRACLCRANAPGPFSVVGAALAAPVSLPPSRGKVARRAG